VQGDILYFDAERGIGFASGDDGNRYHFDRGDLPAGCVPRKGMRIAFTPSGNRAGAIRPEGGFEGAPAAPVVAGREARPTAAVPSVPAGSIASVPVSGSVSGPASGRGAAAASPSLFGSFRYGVTGGYADFRGRARRREYWGFMLFFMVMMTLTVAIGAALDGVTGNLDDEEPLFLLGLTGLFTLAMIVPSVAVTVRRIHDLGLSGWFVLLGLIPSVGSLIILVFALIPSQKRPNKWGEVPAGAL
jgi:uncharacterized membrane protein YhaH (DUF805 family)